MKERPILFNERMVLAILEGRKTVTRRPVKPQPHRTFGWYPSEEKKTLHYANEIHFRKGAPIDFCPYGQPGDRLWLRETFTIETNFNLDPCDPPFSDGRPVKWTEDEHYGRYWEQPHYRATDPAPALVHEDDCKKCEDNGYCNSWNPCIHMPRWASRIILEITAVRVERLNNMHDTDRTAEGYDFDVYLQSGGDPFAKSWDSIYAARGFGWEKNPWVWVVEFKRV